MGKIHKIFLLPIFAIFSWNLPLLSIFSQCLQFPHCVWFKCNFWIIHSIHFLIIFPHNWPIVLIIPPIFGYAPIQILAQKCCLTEIGEQRKLGKKMHCKMTWEKDVLLPKSIVLRSWIKLGKFFRSKPNTFWSRSLKMENN